MPQCLHAFCMDDKHVNLTIELNPALNSECETKKFNILGSKGEIVIPNKNLNTCYLDVNLEMIKVTLRFTGFIKERETFENGKPIVNIGCIWGKS